MWPLIFFTIVGVISGVFYEHTCIEIAETKKVKKRWPTRQVEMEDKIFHLEGRRISLRALLVFEVLTLVPMWAYLLW